jgi:hypothetical protein
MKIPFNIPYSLAESAENVTSLVKNPSRIQTKKFTKLCELYFEELYPGYKALIKEAVDYYEWTRLGSKFELSEFIATILYPLLQQTDEIHPNRIYI